MNQRGSGRWKRRTDLHRENSRMLPVVLPYTAGHQKTLNQCEEGWNECPGKDNVENPHTDLPEIETMGTESSEKKSEKDTYRTIFAYPGVL